MFLPKVLSSTTLPYLPNNTLEVLEDGQYEIPTALV